MSGNFPTYFFVQNIDSIKNLIARELWRNVLIDEAMRKNFSNNYTYGLRKGNKIFVTFATIKNN